MKMQAAQTVMCWRPALGGIQIKKDVYYLKVDFFQPTMEQCDK